MSSNISFPFDKNADVLFCLDMANNHQGSVEHGTRIIKEVAKIAKKTNAQAMIKLQFRNIESLLHPSDKQGLSNGMESLSPHSKRFRETALTKDELSTLVKCARECDLGIYATPFDEPSVDLCTYFGFDVIKVASCSAYDWPLLRKVAGTKLPVTVSLGGMAVNEIDEVVDFFQSSGNPLILMHCVSSYPTAVEDLQLDCIRQLKERYTNVIIGYSGHESPDDVAIGGLAIAKGAQILERHVGLPTTKIKINAYSLSPVDCEKWIMAVQDAVRACANGQLRRPVSGELESLLSLKRGIYARRTIHSGRRITAADAYLAIPCFEGQFHAGKYYEVVDSFTPMQPIYANMPIGLDLPEKLSKPLLVSSIAARVKEMLDNSKISLEEDVHVELSHQYGFERFFEVGAVIIDVVNRDYCKKLIIQLPGQSHPSHRHEKKEETFQVLNGSMDLVLDGKPYRLSAGQKQTVERNLFHSFATDTGVIFEEVSTTHIKGDSEYEDSSIPNDPTNRKTKIVLPK